MTRSTNILEALNVNTLNALTAETLNATLGANGYRRIFGRELGLNGNAHQTAGAIVAAIEIKFSVAATSKAPKYNYAGHYTITGKLTGQAVDRVPMFPLAALVSMVHDRARVMEMDAGGYVPTSAVKADIMAKLGL